jgi:hypothetical protein
MPEDQLVVNARKTAQKASKLQARIKEIQESLQVTW